jgi:hypothetical protein
VGISAAPPATAKRWIMRMNICSPYVKKLWLWFNWPRMSTRVSVPHSKFDYTDDFKTQIFKRIWNDKMNGSRKTGKNVQSAEDRKVSNQKREFALGSQKQNPCMHVADEKSTSNPRLCQLVPKSQKSSVSSSLDSGFSTNCYCELKRILINSFTSELFQQDSNHNVSDFGVYHSSPSLRPILQVPDEGNPEH